jgi:hypothetical protein
MMGLIPKGSLFMFLREAVEMTGLVATSSSLRAPSYVEKKKNNFLENKEILVV